MGFILFVHIAASILLVISILMQAGRGGGLAESFSSAESMFGTQTNVFMVRASTVLAAIFIVTSLTLAVYGIKGNASLMAGQKISPKVEKAAQPAEPQPEVSIKISDPKPVTDVLKSEPASKVAPAAEEAKPVAP